MKQKIDAIINDHAVVLFMKGNRERPQCGFSKQVVQILNQLAPDFVAVDVLADPELREAIKIYSNWPTIPQLYIAKEFIGGCDIVLDLFQKGQLQKLLHLEKAAMSPKIKISSNALTAFKNASADVSFDEKIRISIGLDFEHSLSFDQKQPEDFVINFGDIEIIVDPYSAVRANNLQIDYVTENHDAGFLFENPNEIPAVKDLSVEELHAWHKEGKNVLLIDVRPQFERDMASISFAKPLTAMNSDELSLIKKDHVIVFHCHHGSRSKRAAESFRLKGFSNLFNLSGGIDAWSKRIDSQVPIYTK